jgi:hypothetical protein
MDEKTSWYWEETAMLLLVPAILVFFFNAGMWGVTLGGGDVGWPWYVSCLLTTSTLIVPAVLFALCIDQHER